MHELTQQFTDALHRLHAERDVEPLVALFADEATLSKLGDQHETTGQDGARHFWQEYREVFDDVEATFTHTTEGDGTVVLEWTSRGTLAEGSAFGYAGVSVLEGSEQRIGAFRTYYDSAAFLPTPAAG